jgi:hypothetical protein
MRPVRLADDPDGRRALSFRGVADDYIGAARLSGAGDQMAPQPSMARRSSRCSAPGASSPSWEEPQREEMLGRCESWNRHPDLGRATPVPMMYATEAYGGRLV